VKYLNNVTRARPQVRQKEGASLAILEEFPYSGTNARRDRSCEHDEERADQKIEWKRRAMSGAVCLEPLSDRSIKK